MSGRKAGHDPRADRDCTRYWEAHLSATRIHKEEADNGLRGRSCEYAGGESA